MLVIALPTDLEAALHRYEFGRTAGMDSVFFTKKCSSFPSFYEVFIIFYRSQTLEYSFKFTVVFGETHCFYGFSVLFFMTVELLISRKLYDFMIS